MALSVTLNGQTHHLPDAEPGCSLADLLERLGFKADRIAVEHNGGIVRRSAWPATLVNLDDKLEVVHFVGGGL